MLANLTHNDETMTGQAYTLTWFYVRMDTSKLYFSYKNISSKSRRFKIGTKWKPRPAKTLQICTQFMAGRLISYIWFNFVLIYFEWFWISPEKTMLFWDFCLYGVISHLGIWLRGSSIWNWKVRKQRDKDLMQFLAFCEGGVFLVGRVSDLSPNEASRAHSSPQSRWCYKITHLQFCFSGALKLNCCPFLRPPIFSIITL